MSITAVHPQRTGKRLRNTLVALFAVLLLMVVAVAAAIYWVQRTARAALPQVDGQISVSGLGAEVIVDRDAQGVPHILASSIDDLLFAQGFVTAQDRLWQMDINRRFGEGELAEIFGAALLKSDKRQRILRLRAAAKRVLAQMSPEDREHMDAYARGVNAIIDRQQKHLPIEFRILRYQPRSWTPVDSLIVGLNIAESLSTSFPTEHSREQIEKKLSPEMIADLYPNSSWRDRPPSLLPRDQQFAPSAAPDKSSIEIPRGLPLLSSPMADTHSCEACTLGSNNWVVSGAHTTTGKPLLSNDMHLNHSIPNVWYEVHLKAGGYDVSGVSFPGVPFVIAGHNQRIAWGMTNLGPDVQDLFIENFNTQGEYETPSGWQKPEHHREVIKVKGGEDATLDVIVTRHGPIVSGLFPGETRQLALRWTIYDPKALDFPFYNIGMANNWAEFRSAVSAFGGATQNIVYADIDGHIGYQAAGFVPIRASGDGSLPVPGNDDSHAWTGYVPFNELPSVYDPPAGIIATANGRVTANDYPFMLANEWGSPYRTERIYKVLESGKKFSAADMLALQMDDYSEFDRLCADSFVYAVDHATHTTAKARRAADLMRGWDGRTSIDSVQASMAVLSRGKLWEMILRPKLGDHWKDYSWFDSSVAMEKLLLQHPPRWLPPGTADWDDLIASAVNAAATDRQNIKIGGRKLAGWRWGKFSRVEVRHPIFAGLPLANHVPYLRDWAGTGDWPQSGDGSLTVKAAGRNFGASERMTTDFSNLDASTINIVTGESGQITSSHYLDQWPAWYNGKTFAWPFSASAVKAATRHTLRLEPETGK